MKNFFKLWWLAYIKPGEAFKKISFINSPKLGLVSVILRSLMLSLLYYLILFLIHKVPDPEPYLTFIKSDDYYLFLTFLVFLFFPFEWVFVSGVHFLILSFTSFKNDFNTILNINGFLQVVIQPLILFFDFSVMILGIKIPEFFGFMHLAIVMTYGIFLSAIAYKKTLGLPYWLGGVLLTILSSALHAPFAILFLRQ